jgi:ribosome-interacting GTPase 1
MASLNASPQYYAAEERYRKAKTKEEKLKALYEMLRYAPRHKKSEDLLKQIKKRIAELKKEMQIEEKKKKAMFHREGIQKQDSPMVILLGFENSGKTFIFNKLTNLQKSSTQIPFETQKFEYGNFLLGNLKIIVIDSPSISNKNRNFLLGSAQVCDLVVFCKKNEEREKEIIEELKRRKTKLIEVSSFEIKDFEEFKQKIFENLEVIRIFTKKEGVVSEDALALKKGSKVKDLAEKIHKGLAETMKYAKIWRNNEAKNVGRDFELQDFDIVEIFD